MDQLKPAVIDVEWAAGKKESIPVQFNPTEFSLDKQAQFAEIALPGLNAPLQQYVRGHAEKLTLDLFFDTSDQGMGPGAVSVTTYTDRIYQLIRIVPKRHAPPILTFLWNANFPGALAGNDKFAPNKEFGNQRRNGFKCVMESIKQKFTLFSTEGVPLRATLTVTLREYATLEDQYAQLNLSSPDRSHTHVLEQGEQLATVAHRYYEKPGEWRAIADANGIADPRRISPGVVMLVPRLEPVS